MLNTRLIGRQIAGSRHQSVVFVLCTALSMVTLVSLSGFSRSVHSSFLRDARSLHAADIIIHAHSPFSPPLLAALEAREQRKELEWARLYTFYSVVRTAKGEASLLADLKVVEHGYPFYGKVELASGLLFRDALAPGSVVVEQALLDRLHLHIGDRVRIGDAVLRVRDIVLGEPDRPVNFFSLGPRVFVSAADLPSLGLVGKGSRVEYTVLAKVMDGKELDRISGELRAAAFPGRERVETYRTAGSGVKRFFDNFLFFLNLIGIFTLLLAGIGIQSSLSALLKEQERTIAVMKAVGARSRFIMTHYFGVVSILGLVGTVLGIASSFLLERVLPGLFRGLLPESVELTIPAAAVSEGLLLGLLVVALFTFLPLYRLKEVRPRAIFGKEEQAAGRSHATLPLTGVGALFFVALVLARTEDVKTGVYFVLGVGLLIFAAFLFTEAVLRLLRKLQTRNLALRQAMKGLFRPRNATRPVMITLTASLTMILSIGAVEGNLDATFVRSYPPDAPNLFFVDIQPGQKDAFAKDLGLPAEYYPVVRGTVTAVNGVPVNAEEEGQRRGDNLAREFNLTYREHLLDDERVVAGKGLFRSDWPGPQVSVLDTVQKMRDMNVGDTLTFRIQGIPLEARISSIRTRTRASLQPFFYFVFPEQVMEGAPRTFFTAVRAGKESVGPIRNRIVARYPNVSVIDVTDAVSVFARLMSRLSSIVRFFTLFSVVAGVLIIMSSVSATRYARIQEAVFFTVLGARGRFVLAVFALESLITGLASGLIALLFAQAIGWIVCRVALDIAYTPFVGAGVLTVLAMTLIVTAAGLVASIPILRQRPARFLREQAEE